MHDIPINSGFDIDAYIKYHHLEKANVKFYKYVGMHVGTQIYFFYNVMTNGE